jgi:hypothetical protein
MEAFLDFVAHWLGDHPRTCAALIVYVILPMFLLICHLYWQIAIVRKVFRMRTGDAFWPQRPRDKRPLWQLAVMRFVGEDRVKRWFPVKPLPVQRRRPTTRPPVPFQDPQDAKTPKE